MELIKIDVNEKNEQVVSGRELHEKLEVKSKYLDWFGRMIDYGFVKDVDFAEVNELAQKKEGSRIVNREQINHILSMDMAKQICMIQRSEIGTKFRLYFIECEKQLLQQNKKKDLVYAIYEGGVVAVEAHKILVEMEVEEAVKPVQEALDVKKTELDIAVAQINNLVRLGGNTTFDINTSSKLLGYEGMGERNLFKFMRSNKWINLNNTPSQIMVAKGRAISVLKHNRHMNVDYHQTRLTIKGLFWVGNKLREAGYETFVTDDMLVRQIEELMIPSEIVDSNN